MAFLDLDVGAPVSVSRIAPVRLGAQERRVVLLARTDPVSSLRHSPLGRIARLLFGIEPPHRLADTRLEALRRYAILYRVHGETEAELAIARAAGFADDELAKARSLIDVAFGRRARRHGPAHLLVAAFGLAMTALLAFGAARAVAKAVDSPLVAATLVALAIVSLAPMFARKAPAGRTVYRG